MTRWFSRAGNLIWEAGSWAVNQLLFRYQGDGKRKKLSLSQERDLFSFISLLSLRLSLSLFRSGFEIRLARLPYCREERSLNSPTTLSGRLEPGLGRKAWECPGLCCMVEVCPFRLDLAWHLMGPGVKPGRVEKHREQKAPH